MRSDSLNEHFKVMSSPRPASNAGARVFEHGCVRVSVILDRVVRVEHSSSPATETPAHVHVAYTFDDRPTVSFPRRPAALGDSPLLSPLYSSPSVATQPIMGEAAAPTDPLSSSSSSSSSSCVAPSVLTVGNEYWEMKVIMGAGGCKGKGIGSDAGVRGGSRCCSVTVAVKQTGKTWWSPDDHSQLNAANATVNLGGSGGGGGGGAGEDATGEGVNCGNPKGGREDRVRGMKARCRGDMRNLLGTCKSLDFTVGFVDISPGADPKREHATLGVCSTDGWAVVDDTLSGVFVEGGKRWGTWCASRDTSSGTTAAATGAQRSETAPGGYSDWYLFLHGWDYMAAVTDLMALTGNAPLVPRWALGIWHSQWFPHNQDEIIQITEEFESEGVHLDMVSIDMDFHTTANQMQPSIFNCWGGYTWEKRLFPDPEYFSGELHRRGVKFAVNIHPICGIPSYEKRFAEACKTLGANTALRQIPFSPWDEKWSEVFVDLILPDLYADVIWIDYQASEALTCGVSPSLWLAHIVCHPNQLHSQAQVGTVDESPRPMKLGGWGGIGSHRYPVTHSGDVYVSWESLEFQPFFTNCAANLCTGYCSHDIGGFFFKPKPEEAQEYSAELFVRWVQFGCFSPIMREHSDPTTNRKFYLFPHQYASAAKEALLLRKSLVPYIYTQAKKYYDTGIPFVHPLYYRYQREENAYIFSACEYFFGENLIVRPVTSPACDHRKLISVADVWIPPGKWIHTKWLKLYEGPKIVTLRCMLSDIPVFAKAGSVISRCNPAGESGSIPEVLELEVYPFCDSAPGSDTSEIYEDDGLSQSYKSGSFSVSKVIHTQTAEGITTVTIGKPAGTFKGIPLRRRIRCLFKCCLPPTSVSLSGTTHPFTYNAATLSATVEFTMDWGATAPPESLHDASITTTVTVEVHFPGSCTATTPCFRTDLLWSGIPVMIERALSVKSIIDSFTQLERYDWPPEIFSIASGRSLLNSSWKSRGTQGLCEQIQDIVACTKRCTSRAESKEFLEEPVIPSPCCMAYAMRVALPLLLIHGEVVDVALETNTTSPNQKVRTTSKQTDTCSFM